MNNTSKITNIVIAGLGGQGVLSAANILAQAAVYAGHDVKQSEIHGMSQRGGSVTSDVRFGKKVYSPMVPVGEADFVLVIHPSQQDNNRYHLHSEGRLMSVTQFLDEGQDISTLGENNATPVNQRNCNVALLGVLSNFLQISDENWEEAIRATLPTKVHDQNIKAFHFGKALQA